MPARIDRRNRARPGLVRGVAVLALGIGVLTACGSDEPDAAGDSSTASTPGSSSPAASSSADAPTSGTSTQAQAITATEADFSISLDEDGLTAGTYEIEVLNSGSATHDLVVAQGGNDIAASDDIGPGDTTALTVDLAPGEYVFYCSIGNHRAMGMELTVQVT